ncbi:MAG: hypothetical protein A3K19_04140 [Lentisphaerae bacterium RIFOXYB12_FULL_65_16]|nr:MAG: hypothetical protein A3K18_08245 [Lentisphaerae bacterium RIFOXYA12_64_32]OGV84276.1 MAG: hypothetical protein A3K19_04140 [Lentisphaerae bacterium RIFOXYB12_FULL_65_16]
MSQQPQIGYDDTPLIPGWPYRVHDSKRPQPRVVTPGTASTQDAPGRVPSDAVVLFDGRNLSSWESMDGSPAKWKVDSGYMEVVPKTGNIRTRDPFGDCQLHVEWAEPAVVVGNSQGRGNSGVFLLGQYEIQVLDCYQNPTYADGTTGALYGQFPPLVNACRKPAEWQTYDIIWEGPRFDGDKLLRPAFVTVIQNGLVLHHHRELQGPTKHRQATQYTPHPAQGPLVLQDHGDLVRFRNIWYRPRTDYDQA